MRDKDQILLEQAYQKILLKEAEDYGDEFKQSVPDPYKNYPGEIRAELLSPQGGSFSKLEEVDEEGNPSWDSGTGYIKARVDFTITIGDKRFEFKEGSIYKLVHPYAPPEEVRAGRDTTSAVATIRSQQWGANKTGMW